MTSMRYFVPCSNEEAEVAAEFLRSNGVTLSLGADYIQRKATAVLTRVIHGHESLEIALNEEVPERFGTMPNVVCDRLHTAISHIVSMRVQNDLRPVPMSTPVRRRMAKPFRTASAQGVRTKPMHASDEQPKKQLELRLVVSNG